MRFIEIRRHSLTKKDATRGRGSQLSSAGVAQARFIGSALGSFDLVLTSSIPRTGETAIAMGFAVDEHLDVLGHIPAAVWDEIGHQERWAWEQPFVTFAKFVGADGPTAQMGNDQRKAWVDALERVPEGRSVLIVSHGRVIESGLVATVPDGNFAQWGTPFQHGEGVRMRYDRGRFGDVEFRRVERQHDEAEPLMLNGKNPGDD